MILPLPESKRLVKVAETKYEAQTYGDLVKTISAVKKSLAEVSSMGEKTGPNRYDDKTDDEMREEMARKHKQQFGKMARIRYY